MVFTESVGGVEMKFETTRGVFSPNNIDKGTLAMLTSCQFDTKSKILDLGCGYGVVGIYAAKLIGEENVVMSDIDKNAVALSIKNAALNGVPGVKIIYSDGFKSVDDTGFTHILSNPPYHADFSVPKHFIEKGFNRLETGGQFYMVTKRLEWYKNKLTAIFGGVKVIQNGDFFIFRAEKRDTRYANKKG